MNVKLSQKSTMPSTIFILKYMNLDPKKTFYNIMNLKKKKK